MRPPQSWRAAPVTVAILAATALAWILVNAAGYQLWAVVWGSFIPADRALDFGVSRAPFWLTPLTATLVHSGIVHLAFNLLILAFCGRTTEAVLGRASIVILYLAGAYVAAGAHFLLDPLDATPMVGASGAISAVLGAYAMLFGRNRVKVANPTAALWLNALWLMAAWVILQMIIGLTFAHGGLQVAVAAHVGGFIAGIALARPLLLFRYRSA